MRRALPFLLLLLLVPTGCGNGSGRPVLAPRPEKKPAKQAELRPAEVARGWADALRRGDIDGAARFFALPASVSNGTPLLKLDTRRAVRNFNRALPCGARFEGAQPHHGYLLVTFELVDRRGEGAMRPCQGKGSEAQTAFLIRHGKIVEWRRAADPGAGGSPT